MSLLSVNIVSTEKALVMTSLVSNASRSVLLLPQGGRDASAEGDYSERGCIGCIGFQLTSNGFFFFLANFCNILS